MTDIRFMDKAGKVYKEPTSSVLGEISQWDRNISGCRTFSAKHVSAQRLKDLDEPLGAVKLLSTGNFAGRTSSAYDCEINNDEVFAIPSGGQANIKYCRGRFVDSGNILGKTANAKIVLTAYVYDFLLRNSNYVEKCYRGASIKHPQMEDILGMHISLPCISEQKDVSAFLTGIEEKIGNESCLVEILKFTKKSMLAKMFPKDGKSVPEVRFEGFTDPWEQRKVSDMFKVTRGYVLPATVTTATPVDVNCYPVFSSQTANNGLMGYYKDYLYEDAVTWTTDGANAGTVRYRAGKFYCTNVCGVLLSDKVSASKMVAEALNLVAKKYVSYVGNPKLMNNVMADISIYLPSNQKEQEAISEFLESLDNLITLHQRKLEKWQTVKKALLQEMFD